MFQKMAKRRKVMKEKTMTHQLRRIRRPMLMPTTAPDRCAMKLGWGPEDGSGGEKRSQTARPTSELTAGGDRALQAPDSGPPDTQTHGHTHGPPDHRTTGPLSVSSLLALC
ncbi:hypothetical protein EYF80_050146 [Liparis tanakae]|uniref:Uncharacterized protein n=1 Tax=Liparis tanakae TaxID=230148 RepID=A0A4Z2FH93_9TELE|nr:hypothetical protein EYF80_050146 [Liparis tanakae]